MALYFDCMLNKWFHLLGFGWRWCKCCYTRTCVFSWCLPLFFIWHFIGNGIDIPITRGRVCVFFSSFCFFESPFNKNRGCCCCLHFCLWFSKKRDCRLIPIYTIYNRYYITSYACNSQCVCMDFVRENTRTRGVYCVEYSQRKISTKRWKRSNPILAQYTHIERDSERVA